MQPLDIYNTLTAFVDDFQPLAEQAKGTPLEAGIATALNKLTALTQAMGESTDEPDPACAAIAFALQTEEPMQFLRLWNEGSFDEVREGWPDAPDEVFFGADQFFESAETNPSA